MKRGRLAFTFVFLAALLAGTVVSASGCEPLTRVSFVNERSEDVRVFVADVRANGSITEYSDYGVIGARTSKTLTITFLGDKAVNRIEIRSAVGTVLQSQDYTRPKLKDVDWKIVVSP